MRLIYTNITNTDKVKLPLDKYYIIYGAGSAGHYIGIFSTHNNPFDPFLPSYNELLMLDQDVNDSDHIIMTNDPRTGMSVCDNDVIWELTEDEIIKHVLMETI